jgi:hypothetical protein
MCHGQKSEGVAAYASEINRSQSTSATASPEKLHATACRDRLSKPEFPYNSGYKTQVWTFRIKHVIYE